MQNTSISEGKSEEKLIKQGKNLFFKFPEYQKYFWTFKRYFQTIKTLKFK